MGTSVTVDRYGRSLEETRAIREKIQAANREARENWDNPQWRAEMAQEVTEVIFEGFQHENLLSLLTEVENAPWDGRVFVEEVRGLRAFWITRGGYIEASSMNREVMEIERDIIGFHVQEMTDKFLANFSETQSTLIDLGVQRLDAEVNSRFLRLLQAAIPSSSAYYVTASGLSLTALDTALRQVRDSSRTRELSIVGRATMTDLIIDELTSNSTYTGFLPETNEALLRQGVLGTYRGAKIVTLVNYKDDRNVSFFPANEMFVISRDAAKFAFWGGLMSKEYEELDNWYWHYLARREFGGVVHRPERVRRIVDSSQSA